MSLPAFLRRLVLFLGERPALDLQLHRPAFELVDLGGQRVDLDAQPRRGFVHEIDGLVGQEAIGDVAMGQGGRRDQSGVGDADAVVDLVLLFEAAEDADGLLDGWFSHQYWLEAALERRVLLDVLAVFRQRGGADAPQLAASERRLEQIGRVHGALGGAGADQGVELVDEEDDLAVGVHDLLEDGLEAVLELAAILGAGDEGAHVERDEPAAFEDFGHITRGDALGEALGHRGLADPGFADEHRVVLGPPGEDLHDAADLLVATDDRIELCRCGRAR